MSEPDNPPAFAACAADCNQYEGQSGMSLRDWFAGQAMSHALSATASHDGCYDYRAAAGAAYDIADAMLDARFVPEPEPIATPQPIRVPPAPDACAYCDSGLPEQECACVPF